MKRRTLLLAAPALILSRKANASKLSTFSPIAAATGFPDASNTGVQSVVSLTDSGPITVNSDGTTVSAKRITGYIDVQANNTIVENCEIDASGELWGIGLADGKTGLIVRYCKIYGRGGRVGPFDPYNQSPLGSRGTYHVLSGISTGVVGGNLEVHHCNIYGCENAIANGDGYIHDNWIHDFAFWNGGDDHTDGVQTFGFDNASNLRVIHNTIIGIATMGSANPINFIAGSSAIALSQGMHDLIIDNNYFAGGTFTLYGSAQSGGSPVNNVITNNHFSTQYFARVGEFGYAGGVCNWRSWISMVWQYLSRKWITGAVTMNLILALP